MGQNWRHQNWDWKMSGYAKTLHKEQYPIPQPQSWTDLFLQETGGVLSSRAKREKQKAWGNWYSYGRAESLPLDIGRLSETSIRNEPVGRFSAGSPNAGLFTTFLPKTKKWKPACSLVKMTRSKKNTEAKKLSLHMTTLKYDLRLSKTLKKANWVKDRGQSKQNQVL